MSPEKKRDDEAPEQPAKADASETEDDPDDVETVRGAPDRVLGPGKGEDSDED